MAERGTYYRPTPAAQNRLKTASSRTASLLLCVEIQGSLEMSQTEEKVLGVSGPLLRVD